MTLIKNSFLVMLIIFVILNFSNYSLAQNMPAAKPEPQFQRIAGLNAGFIVALISDGNGGAWIGTEDDGIFHYKINEDPNKPPTLTNHKNLINQKNHSSDNNGYALAIDKLGRLWVGHLNTGVSVFNGKDWKNYDVVDGPIGERIFDIKICPKDGDVWMATSAGITRYKIDADEWEHFTREDGLPEDQVAALAFKFDGTLIVGTQCHGIAVFTRGSDGKYGHSKDKAIVAPDRFGPNNCSPVPLTPMGIGLPSNQINDILVTKNSDVETIWIATNAGLAKANSDLKKVEYWRGRDYANKVRGLYGGAPKDFKQAPKEIMDKLPLEDYLTCLAEDEQGVIWIGTRQNGFCIVDPQTDYQALSAEMNLPDNFVTKILILGEGDYLTGFYGGGVIKPTKPYELVNRKPLKTRFNKAKIFSVAQNNFPNLPSKIKPPTADELRTMYYKLQKIYHPSNLPKTLALNDDWRTQGNYIDRYGRHSAVLCAMAGGGFNFYSGYHLVEAEFIGWIGRNYREKKDSLRNWIQWLESNDPRVLQCLDLGGRRQSEWDDHKEVYPMALDGPHIYGTCKIPKGKYLMSLYFFNKDGHHGANRYRDYLITVKTMKLPEGLFQKLGKNGENAEELFLKNKNGSQTRVREFWGGVWKRFYVEVNDNEFVTFKVDANYSFNTIVSAVMFDPVGELKSRNHNDPLEPRKLTEWATVLNNPTHEYWWWAINAMDTLLYQRDKNPAHFYGYSHKNILTTVRATIRLDNNVPKVPAGLDAKDKKLIRSDVGRILRAATLHRYADMVDFTEEKYEYYRWLDRNRLGRKDARTSDWDWEKFRAFSQENIDKQTW